jgi:hypothetical protein
MKKTILLLFIALLSTNLFSQDKKTISGLVKDARNGERLLGVSVFVKEIGNGALTNDYGFFALTLPKGTYTLIMSVLPD